MMAKIVRPDVSSFLDWLYSHPGPRMHDVSPTEGRRMMDRMTRRAEAPVGELAVIRDIAMPVTGGSPIGLRLFDARTERPPGPVMIFYHGGGFVVGDLDSHAALCAEIARLIDLPVISVDYRLAPEYPWPAAPDDAEAAARWIAGNPPELGIQATGLILAGDSAGGTLTIVTALALRDRPAPLPLLAQWPIYPAVSASTRFRSFDGFGDGYMLDREQLAWFFNHYAADIRHWRATPTRKSQAGLPPTLILTASLDPLLDQGRAYAEQCRTDGVDTRYYEAEGTIHGFLTLRGSIPSGQEDLRRCVDLLKTLIAPA